MGEIYFLRIIGYQCFSLFDGAIADPLRLHFEDSKKKNAKRQL